MVEVKIFSEYDTACHDQVFRNERCTTSHNLFVLSITQTQFPNP